METLTVGDIGAWCARKCRISSRRKEVGEPLLGRQMSKADPEVVSTWGRSGFLDSSV